MGINIKTSEQKNLKKLQKPLLLSMQNLTRMQDMRFSAMRRINTRNMKQKKKVSLRSQGKTRNSTEEAFKMNRYELAPIGSQKSFYGKAVVEIDSAGNETLYSYNTPIMKRLANGSLVKLWGGWSNTTGRHIKAFCGLNKAGFMELEHEPTSHEKAAAYNSTLCR